MFRPYMIAIAFDWIFGEPPNALHPVAWFGKFIGALERRAPRDSPRAELLYGAAVSASGIALATLPAIALENIFRRRGWFGAVLIAIFFKMTFAWRALIQAGEMVRRDLDLDRVQDARQGLRSLVSRNASQLDASLIAAAAIESLAENASDSFVAPVFYYALFGLPGACAYRAVNTMDSMLGYRGRYEFLGKIPARLDDALNLIPARITALFIALAARSHRSFEIMRRDHALTASPNAGYPMTAMAGALDVRLEKVGQYCLNATGRKPESRDILRAERIVMLALGVATVMSILILRTRRD